MFLKRLDFVISLPDLWQLLNLSEVHLAGSSHLVNFRNRENQRIIFHRLFLYYLVEILWMNNRLLTCVDVSAYVHNRLLAPFILEKAGSGSSIILLLIQKELVTRLALKSLFLRFVLESRATYLHACDRYIGIGNHMEEALFLVQACIGNTMI